MISRTNLNLKKYYSFPNYYTTIENYKIHYLEVGSTTDPTILFLHGNPTWSFLYRDVISKLKDEFHCLALDYPGFGLSEQPDNFDYLPQSQTRIVNKFIKNLNLDSFSIMVHDWGGPIGLAVAEQNTELIEHLIITNSWAWPVQKKRLQLFSWLLGQTLSQKLILKYHAFVNYIMPWGVIKKRKEFKEKILPFYRLSAQNPTCVFPREINGSQEFLSKVEANLDKLKPKPTLLIWGKWDPMFGQQEVNKFKANLNPEQIIKCSAGHYLMEDRPQKISSVIKKFFKNCN